MDRQNSIALIERFLDAINALDFETAIGSLHEDVVHDIGHGERIFNREAFRETILRRASATGEQIGDLVLMASDDGTRASAEFTRRGRDIAGKNYSFPGGMFFAIEDRKIVRVTEYGEMPDDTDDP